MPIIPCDKREQYRKWAKINSKAQMDENAWVHESNYSEFLRSCEYCGWSPGCGRIGCRVCDHGYY